MLSLHYSGNAAEAAELSLEAADENLDRVIAFVDERLEALDCLPHEQMQVDVAVEELFINIAHYAYGEGKGKAEICAFVADDVFEARFRDSGIPFDPLKKADPDTTLGAKERPIGGLGIFLVKKNMDEVTYAREDNCNVLTIRKKLR